MFLFLMKLLDRNSLVFGNKEECICLFVSIRKICQRRKYNDQFTFLAFLDLSKKKKKKAFDLVPIYDILKNLINIGICGKCLQSVHH